MATRRQTALSGLGSGWVGVDERRRPVMVTTGDASVGSPSQTRRWRPPRTRRKMGATRHEKVKTVIRVFSTGGSVIYRYRVLLPQNAPRNEAWIRSEGEGLKRRCKRASAGVVGCGGSACSVCLPSALTHVTAQAAPQKLLRRLPARCQDLQHGRFGVSSAKLPRLPPATNPRRH